MTSVQSKPIKVAIVGGTGYTGQELLRLLALHSGVELVAVCSRSEAGKRLDDCFTMFRGVYSLCFSDVEIDLLKQADLVFFATPNGVAMHYAPALLEAGVRIVDLSADFRLDDADIWSHWYAENHACPELLPQAIYGLPELDSDGAIANASIVANPGCYATAIQLSLAPLASVDKSVVGHQYVVDGKSGVSGAGKSATETSLLAQASENCSSYKVSGHRHQPEALQQLVKLSSGDALPSLVFVPHLIPMVRGIITTAYISCHDSSFDFFKWYQDFYDGQCFIDVMPSGLPLETKSVAGTNLCRICPQLQGDRLIVVALIDNLVKGAAGQAIQNMNEMFGFPQKSGLDLIAHYP